MALAQQVINFEQRAAPTTVTRTVSSCTYQSIQFDIDTNKTFVERQGSYPIVKNTLA